MKRPWLSFAASKDGCYRLSFEAAGLRSVTAYLGDSTVVHCWVPKLPKPCKPNLLLLHGFGANAMWQYGVILRHFTPQFNVYVPDLVFFGRSTTALPDRTEAFQARAVMGVMKAQGVQRMNLVGISYGGFVGYSMAVQFPGAVERLVLCCAGVCVEERDVAAGLFPVSNVEEAARILVPQTPEMLRELSRLAFVKPPLRHVPSFFLSDFVKVMCVDHVKEKTELIETLIKDRKLSNLPKITQDTLIIWGEQDRVFPLDLAHRLKRHIGGSARLQVIKNAGHALNLEKPKEFAKHLKCFLKGYYY